MKSSIGLGYLLLNGIGDTIRVSLSADPVEEVKVAFDLLKALISGIEVSKLYHALPAADSNLMISTVSEIERRLSHIKQSLTVSIIGCVVNGPGEAKTADIGLTGGGKNTHQIYISGVANHRLKDKNIVDHIVELVEKYIAEKNKNTSPDNQEKQLIA